ncbi:unnamed protein product [Owenia fusiformis]|uniref:BK channel n=1 Tax=Owenia fusiformis TaxID=6347 RepID=A0A8J1TAJ3_OWEFU|nr:unnamed protein product [Owenia fusiformis]
MAHSRAAELVSGQTVTGRVLVTLSCILSLSSLVLYLIDASWHDVEDCTPWLESYTQQIDLAINLFFLLYFFIRFVAANDKLMFWIDIYSIVDYFTVPPVFVAVYLNRNWLGLRFLRALALQSFPDVMQFLGLIKKNSVIRLWQLIMVFFSVWLAGAGFIHLVENSGDPLDFSNSQPLGYWNCLYICMVTMSTVGYGDLYCKTVIGKVFIVFFIIGALAMFTSVIPEMITILGMRKKYGGSYDRGFGKHIVVCGHISTRTVEKFLAQFLHQDQEDRDVMIVFLHTEPPNLELEALMKRHYTHVRFYEGSVMVSEDLDRVKLKEADAVLLLANKHCDNPDAEDAANIMRVISIKDYHGDVSIIIQLLQYHNKNYLLNIPDWHMQSDSVICLAEMKLGFIAQACLAPGFSTLMANLFMMTSHKKSSRYDEWKNNYFSGLGMELYTEYFSRAFYGMTFPQAVEVCFTKLHMLVIGLEVSHKDKAVVLLNPGPDVKIQRGMQGFFVAQSSEEAYRASIYCPLCHGQLFGVKRIKDCTCSTDGTLINAHNNPVVDPLEADGGFLSNKLFKRPNNNTGIIDANFEDNKPYLEVRESKEQFDATGCFYWCPDSSLDESNIINQKNELILKNLRDHFVVCVLSDSDSPVIGLSNFVMPLRASSLRLTELKPVVIVGHHSYLSKEWKTLGNFPDVYILPGSPLCRADLRRVRINRCKMCVVLSANKGSSIEPTLQDKDAILCSLNIKKMRFEDPLTVPPMVSQGASLLDMMRRWSKLGRDTIPMITDLENDSNCQFLEQDDADDPDIPLCNTETFACGRVFAASVLDSLMSTTYFNRNTLILIRTLITGGATVELEQLLAEGLGMVPGYPTTETLSNRNRCRVAQMGLGEHPFTQFAVGIDATYGNLFMWTLRFHGIMCLGLYRLVNPPAGFGDRVAKRYVLTNPAYNMRLLPSDKIFCLHPFTPGPTHIEEEPDIKTSNV